MIRFFAGHPTAANLLMLILLVMGLLALPDMKRETFPEFTSSVVQISVPYPGASAEEVEDGVCRIIEDALDSVSNMDELLCEAREGVAIATAELIEGNDIGDLTHFHEQRKSATSRRPGTRSTRAAGQVNNGRAGCCRSAFETNKTQLDISGIRVVAIFFNGHDTAF